MDQFSCPDGDHGDGADGGHTPDPIDGDDVFEVEVVAQKGDAGGIDQSCTDKAEDHYGVPGCDGNSDHQQLVNDEGCE